MKALSHIKPEYNEVSLGDNLVQSKRNKAFYVPQVERLKMTNPYRNWAVEVCHPQERSKLESIFWGHEIPSNKKHMARVASADWKPILPRSEDLNR